MREQSPASPAGSDRKSAAYRGSAQDGACYSAWPSQGIEFHPGFRRQPTLPHVSQPDPILDFGCAGGTVLAPLPASYEIGVELNDVACTVAQQMLVAVAVAAPAS